MRIAVIETAQINEVSWYRFYKLLPTLHLANVTTFSSKLLSIVSNPPDKSFLVIHKTDMKVFTLLRTSLYQSP